MHQPSIKLPVVKHSVNKSFSIYRRVFLIIPLLYFLSLFFTEDKNNLNGKIFLLVLVLYIIVGFFLKKPRTINIGYLNFDITSFSYTYKNTTKHYPIQELSNITFTYSGYDGKVRTSSGLMTDTGDDNKLSFVYKKQKIEYRLYIQKYEYISVLKNFFNELNSSGSSVLVKNIAGDKIKF